jgi:hypothetical protein
MKKSEHQEFFATPLLLIDWLSGHCETKIFFIQILLPVASTKI